LGYGNQAIGNIPRNSVLIFEVNLIDVDWFLKEWDIL
jgi:FKBP-type peptidyl-prolyl cis-trans isomerase